MKNVGSAINILILALSFAACSNSSSLSSPVAPTPEVHEFEVKPENQMIVVGEWSDSCAYEASEDAYGIASLIFKLPNKLEMRGDLYKDPGCTQSVRTSSSSGTYALGEEHSSAEGTIRKIDIKLSDNGKDIFSYSILKIENQKLIMAIFSSDVKKRPQDLSSPNTLKLKP